MIVATAGHVDHGKTTLVRVLTGVDTDRLPEERRRGISIDLGFAYLALPEGGTIGFVDVPGHERFIHNMISGVAAIDVGMLVVAADDGVMPQTREHLSILEMLGVGQGIVVITKTDLAGDTRVAEVKRDIERLLAGRAWQGSDLVEVSAPGGAGVDALRATLFRLQASARRRYASAEAGLRFIIDRAFVATGSGTVVTGTVVSGTLSVGDTLVVSPAGVSARVRAIQQNGVPVPLARPGQRYAINVAGVDRDQAGRGQLLVSAHLHRPSERLDVEIMLTPEGDRALRHWMPVHFHSGAAHVLARVILSGREEVGRGIKTFAQLLLAQPVTAFAGDHFVLRDQSAWQTIAGGVVVDPFGTPRRRGVDRTPQLQALASGLPEVAFSRLLDAMPEGVDIEAFGVRFGLSDAQRQRLVNAPGILLLRGRSLLAFRKDAIDARCTCIVRAVEDHHAKHPHERGIAQRALHRLVAPALPLPTFASLLKYLSERGVLDARRDVVRRQDFRPTERDGATRWLRSIEPALLATGYRGIRREELLALAPDSSDAARDLSYLVEQEALYPFTNDRYLTAAAVERLVALVQELARMHRGGFAAAQFRDHAGVGRNLTIDLLEFLDRRGVTFRVGNVRYLREDESADAAGAVDAGSA